jgi:hypothetical protein
MMNIITLSCTGAPPQVKAKSWTRRAAVYWLHPPVEKAPKPITGYKVKRWRIDDGEWRDKVDDLYLVFHLFTIHQ